MSNSHFVCTTWTKFHYTQPIYDFGFFTCCRFTLWLCSRFMRHAQVFRRHGRHVTSQRWQVNFVHFNSLVLINARNTDVIFYLSPHGRKIKKRVRSWLKYNLISLLVFPHRPKLIFTGCMIGFLFIFGSYLRSVSSFCIFVSGRSSF